MKILDATTVIAFLSEMKFPEGLDKLSKYCKIVIPEAVANEITKCPGKQMLSDLVKQDIVEIVVVDQEKVSKELREYPQIHKGECEAVILAQSYGKENTYVVSDDKKARSIFQHICNFKWTKELLAMMKDMEIIDDCTYSNKIKTLKESPFYSTAST